MYSSLHLRMARSGRYPEFGGRPLLGGGVNVQYEGRKTPVPELASAIWSESAIEGVRYRRFHCNVFNVLKYTCTNNVFNVLILIMYLIY